MDENEEYFIFKSYSRSFDHIMEFIKDKNFENFNQSRLIQSAVIRELEIIGEATKNISEEIRNKFKNIPWKKIAGMKDKLTHGYFTVDLKEVWNTAEKDIPILKKDIQEIIKLENIE